MKDHFKSCECLVPCQRQGLKVGKDPHSLLEIEGDSPQLIGSNYTLFPFWNPGKYSSLHQTQFMKIQYLLHN